MVWDPQRRRSVYISGETLRGLLDLPAGWQLMAIHPQNDPLSFRLVVHSESFEPVPVDAESPRTGGLWDRSVVVHGGQSYVRWQFTAEPNHIAAELGTVVHPGAQEHCARSSCANKPDERK